MDSELKVFKFGGASLKDASSFFNVANIIKNYSPLTVVLSASSKVTDNLESLIQAYFNKSGTQNKIWEKIKKDHLQLASALFNPDDSIFDILNDLFVEVEWILDEEPNSDFNYCYDQIIGIGELLSSRIMCSLLHKLNFNSIWLDARNFIITDDNYREGWVYWTETFAKVNKILRPVIENGSCVIMPGFIGSTPDNTTVSLGREGSDYSAAIITHSLDATSLTIWKDVAGVYSADPKVFPEAVLLPFISFNEAIEMTYYGAKVIHLKTIKPLQAKKIPLIVKSFVHPEKEGTVFGNHLDLIYPPIYILDANQILLNIEPKDFSFIAEKDISFLFNVFHEIGFQVNLIQNSGVHLAICGNCTFFDATQLEQLLQPNFIINIQNNCHLLSIRHYSNELKLEMLSKYLPIITGDVNGTFQLVYST